MIVFHGDRNQFAMEQQFPFLGQGGNAGLL